MTGVVAGIVASEPIAAADPNFTDKVVFQSTFDGTNNGTNAIDESPVHAALTFTGPLLSNTQHLFDAACSLRCTTWDGRVSAPANTLYNIGEFGTDFTVEMFFRTPGFFGFPAMQMVGLWAHEYNATAQQWRVVIDDVSIFFQAVIDGILAQWSVNHNLLTDTWYFFAFSRSGTTLRIFRGELDGMTVLLAKREMSGSIDTIAPAIPLFIGGHSGLPGAGSNAWYQHMRITRGAWYRSDDSFVTPSHKFGYGFLYPSLVVDSETFYTPRIGQTLAPLVPHDDQFYAPTLKRTPSLANAGGVSVNAGTTFATPTLVGSRVNGNVLIAWVTTSAGAKTFAVGGGWTIGDQQSDANSSSAWAWRIVDGTEAAPTFTWTGSAANRTRMLQYTGTNASAPIGNILKSQGASANLIINGGVGLTTSGAVSTALALLMVTASNQAIANPTGYTAVSGNNDANGSDRGSHQAQGLAGSVSSPVNMTITAAFWHGYLIELKVI